jgi:hypothetical protein
MARTLWCDAWADWADEQHRTNPDVRHYPPGCELMAYLPKLPDRAFTEAWRLFGRIEEANQNFMAILCDQAWHADGHKAPPYPHEGYEGFTSAGDEYWRDFGHCLVMGALGHGVSWFDDHEKFELKFPIYTYVDFQEELEALDS